MSGQNSCGVQAAVPTPPGPTSPPGSGNMKPYPEKDCETESNTFKHFSVSILKDKIAEYKSGKYTEKYIRTYLDFVHLEGIIDNLQYLELKKYLGEINV